MPVFNNALAGAAGSGGAGYKIERSLRFNSADSAYLNFTPSTSGNKKTWTWSGWVKKCANGGPGALFGAISGGNYMLLRFRSDNDRISIDQYNTGNFYVYTDAVFRDNSAWYHIVCAVDTTQATASNRIKIWVNGVEQTLTAGTNWPTQHQYTYVNDTSYGMQIGTISSVQLDGYLADVHLIDGQALAPTDFGEFDEDTGVWNPIEYSGTYNGAASGNYASSATLSGDTPDSLRPLSNLFNGQLDDYGFGSTLSASGSTTATWSTPIPTSGTVRIRGALGGNSSQVGTNTGFITVNGTDLTGDFKAASGYTTAVWVDITNITSNGISTVEVAHIQNSGYAVVTAIEVDGVVLVDIPAGVNGFRLDFSDNSSNAALGTDSSGNNNTWTVSNLNAADSGVVYSSKLSTNTTIATGSSLQNAFDGDTTTDVYGNHPDGGYFELSGVSVPYTTSLEVYYPSGRSAATVTLNGNNVTVNTADAWNTIATGSGTLTSLKVSRAGDSWFFSAIRVDGTTILIDYDPANADSLRDSPTNYTDGTNVGGNYAILNPLNKGSTITLSNGNLDASASSISNDLSIGTIGVSSGKYYWETTLNSGTSVWAAGVIKTSVSGTNYSNLSTNDSYAFNNTSTKYNGQTGTSYGSNYSVGDVIGTAVDLDGGTITFYINGSSQGTAFTGLSGTFAPLVLLNTSSVSINFGQRPFAYTPPTGYKSLCTTNLTDPTIEDGGDYFEAKIWTGDGTTRTITLDGGFSPDLVWVKNRSNSNGRPLLYDTIRGAGANKALASDDTAAEGGVGDNSSTGYVSQFYTDGFQVNSQRNTNIASDAYVAWCWDAGSSTASNTDGTITSSVRVNQSAGFSIVSYTGTGAAQTTGHGLNATPAFVILKNRDTAGTYWQVFGDGFERLQLNTTQAELTGGYTLDRTSTTISPTGNSVTNNQMNANGDKYIAYCFAPVKNYSQFGVYTGNGSTDGPFVYTGFRPAWIMYKNASATTSWVIFDSTRDTYNVSDSYLLANSSAVEADADTIDFLSNGFKIRSSAASPNGSGNTIVYMAFAENPFQANGGLAR